MMNSPLKLLSIICLSIFASSVPSSANVEERYAEFKAVPEAINDPDPLMRLAKLEEIVAEGDTTKIQIALRTAFTVDDPNIQALALRAHFASFETVIIEAKLPDPPKDENNAEAYNKTVDALQGVGLKFPFLTDYSALSQSEFNVIPLNYNERRRENYAGTGNIRGNVISITAHLIYKPNHYAQCSFELAEYDGFTVKGTGSCALSSSSIEFPVQLRLF